MTATEAPKTTLTLVLPRPQLKRHTLFLCLLGAPALAPVVFMLPAVVTLNGATNHSAGNDVLGSGGMTLLFAMLAVTPLRTLTEKQWFVPLRRWYGVMFGITIFLDAALASNDPAFAGPVVAGRLAGHTFLLLGFTMTMLLLPLTVQGIWNQWSMRQLGKYWKPFQRYGTYTVWALLGVHLALLEGFGVAHADGVGPDRFPFDVLHQRVYQFASCTALMLALRLPAVRRWTQHDRKRLLFLVPLLALFAVAYFFLLNELVYKGTAAFVLNPVND